MLVNVWNRQQTCPVNVFLYCVGELFFLEGNSVTLLTTSQVGLVHTILITGCTSSKHWKSEQQWEKGRSKVCNYINHCVVFTEWKPEADAGCLCKKLSLIIRRLADTPEVIQYKKKVVQQYKLTI